MSVKSAESPGAPALTVKGADTRQRIVAAAARLMFERGVTGTTMEQVRAAAQVSSSQIYHYFVDKQALVHAVVEYQNETVVGGQELTLADLDKPAGLRAWFDFLIADQRRRGHRGCPVGLLAGELADLDPGARTGVGAAFTRWEEGIRTAFRDMYRRGELPVNVDADGLATATLAAVQGALLLTKVRRTTEPLEQTRDMLLDHVARLTESAVRAVGTRVPGPGARVPGPGV
ncbi:TetR/AcrR family transcriptional regulator [Amycolatopsis taiwanensis]|uniref:Transcriptional regulator n=1 Tax=Amycolatopsis taiwanensis TaxID=342230 RepID=A0A9W6VG49_9PSEU|nr:TetR/AcrR family transcriptional regulator [Amycolatopsis taiwanensis]GLY65559.1 transcriptional regulator [Amycolatopsis taiwanensis]